MVTMERLQERRREYEQAVHALQGQLAQVQGNLYANQGALQAIDKLIAEMSPVVMSPASPQTKGKGE